MRSLRTPKLSDSLLPTMSRRYEIGSGEMSDPTYMDLGNDCCNASESWEDCDIIEVGDTLPHAECYKAVCNGCDSVTYQDCKGA